mmetsp:Transcript_13715/g.25863  ORF Transcript_13715/g.25863 Transcript_13715/m.25863 type:complete len:463 (-) Transcript_13715:28-1416(-)
MKFATLFIGVLVVVISYLLRSLIKPANYDSNNHLIKTLREAACDSITSTHSYSADCQLYKAPSPLTCKLGFTFAISKDYIGRATEVLEKLQAPTKIEEVDSINTLDKFVNTFAYYFASGISADIRVPLDTMATFQLTLHKTISEVGGSSMKMGLRAVKEGCLVGLAGNLNETYLDLLPNIIEAVSSPVDKVDRHFILEIKKGDRFHSLIAPKDFRITVHSDRDPKLETLSILLKRGLDVLVVSGLELLSRDHTFVQNVKKLVDAADYVYFDRKKTHVEVPDVRDESVYFDLRSLFRKADSMSFSEAALMREVAIMTGHSVKNINLSPSPKQLVESFVSLLKYYKEEKYQLNRIHLNSPKLQVICNTGSWAAPTLPTSRAALMAVQIDCNATDIQSTDITWEKLEFYVERSPFVLDDKHPIQDWTLENMRCAAALVPQCAGDLPARGWSESAVSVALAFHNIT